GSVAVWSITPAQPSRADVVEGRLRAYETGLPVSLVEMELQTPFGDRGLRPAIQRLGRMLEQTMPEKARQRIGLDLYLAGRPAGLGASDFIAVRYVSTGLLCCLGIGIGLLFGSRVVIAVGAAVGAVAGPYITTRRPRVNANRRCTETQ